MFHYSNILSGLCLCCVSAFCKSFIWEDLVRYLISEVKVGELKGQASGFILSSEFVVPLLLFCRGIQLVCTFCTSISNLYFMRWMMELEDGSCLYLNLSMMWTILSYIPAIYVTKDLYKKKKYFNTQISMTCQIEE